jgi:hypothetical protein
VTTAVARDPESHNQESEERPTLDASSRDALSPSYKVSAAELADLSNAVLRRDGAAFLHRPPCHVTPSTGDTTP